MLPIIGVITFLLLLVYYSLVSSSRNKEYFKSRKVLDLNNTLFRVLVDGVLKGKGVSGMIRLNYEKMVKAEAGIAGNIFMNQVDYFVADLELLKHICIKDFQHFGQRRIIAEIQDPLINRMVFFQTCPQQWRALRSKLSPTLSLTRVKQLFPAFDETSQKLVNYIVTHRSPSGEINLAQAASKFALASAASALFGLDCGALDQGEPSVFERIGNRLKIEAEFNPGQFLILLGFPKLASFFGLSMFGKELRTFFESQVKSVLQNPDNKNNVVQWITESRVTNDEQLELDQTLSDDDIVSNAVLFLFTGFQPISSILLFASYALSQRPRVQEKLGAEVDAIWEKNGGSFTYESLAEMPYLDQVINETLRLFPPASFADRLCVKDYPVPGTELVIRKGDGVIIPITGIHHDQRYYPEPEQFRPERFSPENKKNIPSFAFLPFGAGSRSCIGSKFALTEVKLALAHIIRNFDIESCPKTRVSMKFQLSLALQPKDGMWLSLRSKNGGNLQN